MEISQSPKLLPGTSGPEDSSSAEVRPVPSPKKPRRSRSKASSTVETPPVEVVEDSGRGEILSQADLKLAIRMNKGIMKRLGLDARSRSFRV